MHANSIESGWKKHLVFRGGMTGIGHAPAIGKENKQEFPAPCWLLLGRYWCYSNTMQKENITCFWIVRTWLGSEGVYCRTIFIRDDQKRMISFVLTTSNAIQRQSGLDDLLIAFAAAFLVFVFSLFMIFYKEVIGRRFPLSAGIWPYYSSSLWQQDSGAA